MASLSTFLIVPMLIVGKVVEYQEGCPSISLDTDIDIDMDEYSKAKAGRQILLINERSASFA
ncbi:hypothetical protein GGI19_007054, partial [Coemansia pectinata]